MVLFQELPQRPQDKFEQLIFLGEALLLCFQWLIKKYLML
jgi:hypothetical protein